MSASRRSTTRRRRRCILAAVCGLALQAAAADEPPRLTSGRSAALTVDNGSPATLLLSVRPNEATRLTIDQDEPSLRFQMFSTDGREIRAVSPGYAGVIEVTMPPSEDRAARLVITAPVTLRAPATLGISLQTAPITKAELTAVLDAEQMFLQAQLRRREPKADSLKEAITLFRGAQGRWRDGGSRSGQCVALAAQGDVWFQLSSYNEALRAYSLARQTAAPGSRLEAFVWNAEANVYLELWQREKAAEAANRALAISRKEQDGRGEADALASLSMAKYLLSQDGAVEALQESLEIARSRGSRVAMARILGVQAWLERDRGRLARALALMAQSAQLFQETGRVVDAMGELLDISVTEGMRGDAYSAIVSHIKLSKLFHEAGSVFLEANAANNIGLDYVALNRARDALPYFREARRLFAATGNVWAAQGSLGLTCETELSLRLYLAARPHCEESKRIAAEFRSPPHEALADSRLGKIAEHRGELSRAVAYYGRALELSSSAGYLLGEASANSSIGLVLSRRGDRAGALERFERALSLSQQAEDQAGIVEAKYQTARLHAEAGRLDEARRRLEEATGLYELGRYKIRSDRLRSSYFAAVRKCYDLYVDVLMRQRQSNPGGGFDRQGLETAEAARARTLFDVLSVKSASRSRTVAGNGELEKLREALSKRYESRLNLKVGGQARELDANAAEIRRLTAEYEQALAVLTEDAVPTIEPLKPITEQDLSRVSSDAIILEYHLAEPRSYLWRIERGNIRSRTLPGRKIIASAVGRWRDLASARQRRSGENYDAHRSRIEAADRELSVEAAKLSCMLLAGMQFPKDRKLIVVTDGILQSLPFAALPADGCRSPGSPPLVARHEIVNASSLRILTGERSSSDHSGKKDVAILADPVFSANDSRVKTIAPVTMDLPPTLRVALRDTGFGAELPRLYATRKEAEAIAAVAPRGSSLLALDFQANLRTALSTELSSYRIWHFATHGLLDKTSPDLSGLVFSLVDVKGNQTAGYLKIQDIFELSIDPTLVVLSACNSGLGEQVDGEGAVGLAYAFLHAGAKQVISTLWSVDDTASSELMAEFYRRHLRDQLSVSAALRQAQLAISSRKRTSQPFYWAAYVLISH